MAVLRREVRDRKSVDETERHREKLERHRAKLERAHRVRNSTQLVAMVDALGFCFAFTGESSYPVPAVFDRWLQGSAGALPAC